MTWYDYDSDGNGEWWIIIFPLALEGSLSTLIFLAQLPLKTSETTNSLFSHSLSLSPPPPALTMPDPFSTIFKPSTDMH